MIHWKDTVDGQRFTRTQYIKNLSKIVKGAEATCMKIATETKKCSRLKKMSNFTVLLNFQPI